MKKGAIAQWIFPPAEDSLICVVNRPVPRSFPFLCGFNMSVKKIRAGLGLFKEALAGSSTLNYTEGSIARVTFLLAVPMILEMAMESVFAIVDIFFVAGLGAAAVATVGLTEAMMSLLYAVAIGLSVGTTAMVARRTVLCPASSDACEGSGWAELLFCMVFSCDPGKEKPPRPGAAGVQ